MPFYLVTIKNPGRAPRYHEKEIGPCNMSPNCTDCEGAHHTYLAKSADIRQIYAVALKEGVHITRVEELYHIREYEATDVSVRDDADRPIGLGGALDAFGITQYDPSGVPGFGDIPYVSDAAERIYYSSDPHGEYVMGVDTGLLDRINNQFADDLHAALDRGASYVIGDDGSRGDGEVPGADSGQQDLQRQTEEGDYRIGPDGDGIIRN